MAKKEDEFEQPITITLENLRHKHMMEEHDFVRKTEEQKHLWAQERHRIENAEAKKREVAAHEREKDIFLFKRDNWKRQ